MTRRTDLPTVEDVQLAIKELGETIGKPPTVLAVARRLGLANTTFRRNFPDLTANLQNPPSTTTRRRTRPPSAGSTSSNATTTSCGGTITN